MNITNEEFGYMVECTARDLTAMLIEKRGMDIEDALNTLYNSDTYSALKSPETGLYCQSPLYVYDYLNNEILTGKMQ
jgi:hypothetical protein